MADTQDNIVQALDMLDPSDDEHWTEDGSPRVDKVREITGIEDLSREEITDAAPQFMRPSTEPEETPVGQVEEEKPKEEVAELSPVEEEPEVSDEEAEQRMTAYGRAMDDLDNNITAINQELADKKNALLEAKAERARVQEERDAEFPPKSPAEAYREVVARAHAERASRVGARIALEDLAGKPLDIRTGSALDESMKSRRGFGNARPAYPQTRPSGTV